MSDNQLKKKIFDLDTIVQLTRLISHLHDRGAGTNKKEELSSDNMPRGYVVGITGVGGVGKSTLIDKLIAEIRKLNKTVAVLAIDPTSVNTGGAFLGDRTRMQDHFMDQGVFIRSLATRGENSALTQALPEIISATAQVADYVIVETAGAGQVDTRIHNIVKTLILVVAPLGDEITNMKSGQSEHAHIIAINERVNMLNIEEFILSTETSLGNDILDNDWQQRVLKVNANIGTGIKELFETILLRQK